MDKKISLYVGNIPYDASETELRSVFEFAGYKVSRVKICTDRDTGKARGFAFVDIDGDFADVIETLNGQDFGGREMRIREATPKPTIRRNDRQADRDLL